jgi:hypothetical protein
MTANVSGGTTDNEEEEEDAMVITYCESGEKGSMRAHGFTVNNSRAKYRIGLQSDGLKYYRLTEFKVSRGQRTTIIMHLDRM